MFSTTLCLLTESQEGEGTSGSEGVGEADIMCDSTFYSGCRGTAGSFPFGRFITAAAIQADSNFLILLLIVMMK